MLLSPFYRSVRCIASLGTAMIAAWCASVMGVVGVSAGGGHERLEGLPSVVRE